MHELRQDPYKAPSLHQAFDTKLSIRILLAILCTTILAVIIFVPTYRDFILARQNLYDIQRYRLILDTANLVAAERGPSNIVMSEDPIPMSEGAKRLAEIRARTDAALAALSASPDAPLWMHDHPVPADMLASVRDQLAFARAKVDRVALVPRASLRFDDLQGAIESMFEASDRFQAIIAWRANDIVQHDTGLAASVLVGQMLTDLRDYGGRMASQILAAVATAEELRLSNVVDSRQSQGRVRELWQVVKGIGTLHDNASLAQSRAQIEQLFFGEGLPLIDKVIREGRSADAYSLTTKELTDLFVPTMRPIETYRSAFLDAAVNNFVRARTSAFVTLGTVLLVTSTILGILIGLFVSIRLHIFRPLFQAHQEIIRLAEDRPPSQPTRTNDPGEIRNLFGALEVLQDRMQVRSSLLRTEADTDSLTTLLNRRALDRIVQERSATPHNGAVCLVLMDIDHFKAINDTYGHPTGDRVLVQTAELVRSLLRSGDIIARFGGEEFAILVPGNELSGAISIARKIRLELQRQPFTTSKGERFSITASFGVARGQLGFEGWQVLLQEADVALYRAKSEGRNRVRFARRPSGSDSAPTANVA